MDTDDYYFMETEQRPTNPIRSGDDDDDDDEMEMMRGWVGGYGGYCTETKRLCAHIKSTDIETDRQTRIRYNNGGGSRGGQVGLGWVMLSL